MQQDLRLMDSSILRLRTRLENGLNHSCSSSDFDHEDEGENDLRHVSSIEVLKGLKPF